MPPNNLGAKPDSTGSYHSQAPASAPELVQAVRDWLAISGAKDHLVKRIYDHSAHFDHLITNSLAKLLVPHIYKDSQNWPTLRSLRKLFPEHTDEVRVAYCEACRKSESTCGHRKRYQIDKVLGRGGFGEVVLARDTERDRLVAIKYSHDPLADDHSTIEEVQSALTVHGPRFVEILRVLTTSTGRRAIVMEYVNEDTVADKLKDVGGCFPKDQACAIIVSLLAALAQVHNAGFSHNDLKPSNLFLNDDDSVRLSDFGAARKLPSSRGPYDQYTPQYCAPEILEGRQFTVRSDVFSVGCIAFELIEGRKCLLDPKNGLYGDFSKKTPKKLQKIIRQALDFDPMKRIPTAKDFRRKIEIFINGSPTLPPPILPPPPELTLPKYLKWLPFAGAIFGGLAGAVAGYAIAGR